MDLVQSYCLTLNRDGSYTIDFGTTEAATVSYTVESDGTNVIKVSTDKKGKMSFSNNFSSTKGEFKFTFEQPDGGIMKRIPSGGVQP